MTQKLTYAEQLKHPKWQKCRLEVLEWHRFRCYSCQSEDKTLHVHHKRYEKGAMAWEYPIDNFEALCETCHAEAHALKEQFNRVVAQYPSEMLGALASLLVGLGDEYVDPVEWDSAIERWADAGRLAWLMLNLKDHEVKEAADIFQRNGPDLFIEALRAADATRKAESA